MLIVDSSQFDTSLNDNKQDEDDDDDTAAAAAVVDAFV